MKTLLRRAKLALFLITCLSGCTYEPHEEFFKEISHSEPDVSISLNSFDNVDTLYVWSDVSFNYDLEKGKGRLEGVQVLINDKVISSSSELNGEFSLRRNGDNWSFLKTGVYELKLQFVATTGTGSLADQVGAEHIEVWRKWILVIDVDSPPKPVITFSNENGFLKVSWNKYTKPNFRSYIISKVDERGNVVSKQFNNSAQNYWIDSSYVGGYARDLEYNVGILAFEERWSGTTLKNDVYSMVADKMNPLDSTVTLRWTKNQYYGALKQYAIGSGGSVGNALFTSTNPLDTTANVKVPSIIFGVYSVLYLHPIPKYKSNYVPFPNINVQVRLGNQIKYPDHITFNSDRNQYISYGLKSNRAYFYLYDTSLNLVDSVQTNPGTPSIPTRGNYVFYDSFNEVGMIDLNTGVKKNRRIARERYNFKGTSNGLITYSYYFSAQHVPYYYSEVYDIVNTKVVYSYGATSSVQCDVSDDGNYLWVYPTNEVFKVTNGITSQLGTFAAVAVQFRQDKPTEMLALFTNRISVAELSNTVTFTREYQLPLLGNILRYAGYDPMSKYAVYEHQDSHVIYLTQVDTGASKKIKTYGTRLVNGTLFAQDGYYLKII